MAETTDVLDRMNVLRLRAEEIWRGTARDYSQVNDLARDCDNLPSKVWAAYSETGKKRKSVEHSILRGNDELRVAEMYLQPIRNRYLDANIDLVLNDVMLHLRQALSRYIWAISKLDGEH